MGFQISMKKEMCVMSKPYIQKLAIDGNIAQHLIFVVNEEPYCIWEVNLRERNKEFLEGIDTEYFDFALDVHFEADDEKYEANDKGREEDGGKRASISLKATLHHAIETMFSLLGAYIQAPDCVYAWIAKCSNKDLRELVKKISGSRNDILTRQNIEEVTWKSIAECVFRNYLPETEKNKQTVQLFASFWKKLAYEYLDKNHIDEYNSIKHGFRIKSGGFTLTVGLEHECGVSPPPEEMKIMGKSNYGTTFLRIEPIGKDRGNRSLCSKRISLNWTIEKTSLLLQFVSMSIKNITSALKIANGAEVEKCDFVRPPNDADFEKAWSYSPGVTSCNFDYVLPIAEVVSVTKSELLERLNKGN